MKEIKGNSGERIGNNLIIKFLRKIDNGYFLFVIWYIVIFIDSIKFMGVINMKYRMLFFNIYFRSSLKYIFIFI